MNNEIYSPSIIIIYGNLVVTQYVALSLNFGFKDKNILFLITFMNPNPEKKNKKIKE